MDMDKTNELNSYSRNRKAESVLVNTQAKQQVEYCLNNGKILRALLETITDKERLIENLNTKIQCLVVVGADKLNELYRIILHNITCGNMKVQRLNVYRSKKHG